MCSNLLDERARERFEDNLLFEPNGCWRWTGVQRSHLGYGGFNYQGRMYQAHRVSYVLFRGHIPPGLHIDHLCRNPWCVNPEHLEPVTSRENTLRGIGTPAVNATKTHCIHGHSFSGTNLVINNRGHRVCRICFNEISRRSRLKKRGDSLV